MAASSTNSSDMKEDLSSADSTQNKLKEEEKLSVKSVPSETVTKAESQKFGTTDPFLTKRTSNIFGVTGSSIGSYTVSREQRSATNASTHSKNLLKVEEVSDDADREKKSEGHEDFSKKTTSASSEPQNKENVQIISSKSTDDERSRLKDNSIKKKDSEFPSMSRSGDEILLPDESSTQKKSSEFSSKTLLSRRDLSTNLGSKQSGSSDFRELPLMNTDYLKIAVGKYLCEALCEVAIRRPERPIEFLAYHLISLYERDLEMKRLEEEKKLEDNLDSPMISQISDSVEQQKEPTAESPLISSVVSQMFTRKLSISDSTETTIDMKEESASAAVSESRTAQQGDSEIQLQPSDHSITEDESIQFGTTEPFLARRGTNVFDVSGMPIGSFSISSERRMSYASTSSRSTLDTQESISKE